ncbi:MAG: D-alanine--D-alanine ligase [Holosporales bacterium]|jgi:D-alanine-D-alanine ligase|nr:D-alanine--D-alanine ligase [Holosporales bacterium]
MQKNCLRITILKGGWSSEREISLKSAEFVANELTKLGHSVYELDIIKKDLRYLTDNLYNSNPDYVVNILHGCGGEDGVIQGVLEVFGVPYNSSGVLSSAIAFHKSICKNIVHVAGVNVIGGFGIRSDEIKNINIHRRLEISYPFVVKPAENGSSIGVFLISNDFDLANLKGLDWVFGKDVIVEHYIYGREFSVLVVDERVVGAVEILPKNQFYDYGSKYEENGSIHLCDFEIELDTRNKMYEMAETAFVACHCKGMARVDFKFDGRDIYFLEINTQPGMTASSLVPDIARFNHIRIDSILANNLSKSPIHE